MKKKFLACLTIGLFMFGFVGLAQATLIENGDFQTGDLTGWDHASNITITTGGGGNSVARFNVLGGSGDARLFQNFYVNPSWAGINVEFEFKLATGGNSSDDFFKSFLRLETDDGTTPDVLTNIIKQYDATSGWQSVSGYLSFTGLSIDPVDPNARLVFLLDEHIGDWSWAVMDNVVVSAAPVPEPSTILLMSTGLLGLVAYNRKRFSKKS